MRIGRVINSILNLKDNFSSTLKKIASNTTKFSSQLRTAEAHANRLSKSFSNFAKASAAIGVTAMGAFVGSSLKTFESFEQAMANTAGLSGIDQSSEAYARMEKAARDAGKATTKTAEESANALGYMALAGWSVDNSINGLMPILRLSEATQADLATTSDLVTDSMSALGIGVDELGHYLDVATMANNKSNQSATQLMEAYIGVGGSFKRLGTPIEESSALLGVLANRGIKGSEAGNSLSAVMINLTKKSGESAQALEDLGINAYDSEGKFKGVTNVLEELNEKTKGLTAEQRDNYLTMIGGKTQITTLNALMSGLNTTNAEGVSELEQLRNELENAEGALDQMADTVNNTMHGAFARMGSAIDDLKIEIGKKLDPYITPFINMLAEKLPIATEKFGLAVDQILPKVEIWFKKIGAVFSWLYQHADILVPALIGVVTALGSFVVITKVTGFVKKMIKTGGKLNKVLKALNLTMLANPFTWIAVGIGVLVAAFIIAYKKSETFRTFVNRLWEKLKEFGKGILSIVVLGLQKFYAFIQNKVVPILIQLASHIPPLWEKFKEFASAVLISVLPVLQSLWQWFKEKIIPTLAEIAQKIQKLWNEALWPFIQWIMEKLNELWKNILEPIALFLMGTFYASFMGAFEAIKGLIQAAVETIKGMIESLLQYFGGIIDFLTGFFTGNWELAWQGIVGIFEGIFNGIKSIAKGVINVVISGINGVISGVNGLAEMASSVPFLGWAKGINIPLIPQFAKGTNYFSGGGMALVGEEGPELVTLPGGSKVSNTEKTRNILSKNAPIINVYIQGAAQSVDDIVNEMVPKIKRALANV